MRHWTYHGGENSLQHSAEDVEYITNEPHYYELYRERIGAGSLEVLYDLRRKDNHYSCVSIVVKRPSLCSWKFLPQHAMEMDLKTCD